jgi:hypothetical protein
LLVDAGLTPFEALQAATRMPAEFLNQLGDLGVPINNHKSPALSAVMSVVCVCERWMDT